MRVAIYARVSSDRQDVDLSISAQLKALRDYASRNNYVVAKEYIDEAESGRSIDRPGFKQMVATARLKPPPFEAILVWKLSRFARNREDSIIYKSLLRKHGVQVVSINEPIEDTPSGRLLEGMIEVIDEFYSANLAQDVSRGMRENASRGFYAGGPVPFGYRMEKIKDGQSTRSTLVSDSATSGLVKRMFEECLKGKGLKEIARELNGEGLRTARGKSWSKTTVHSIVTNEAYTGTLIWGRKVKRGRSNSNSSGIVRVENAWQPVVSKETFEAVQATLVARSPKIVHPRIVNSDFLLSGLIKCAECGTAMVGHTAKSGQFFYYRCGKVLRYGPEACPGRLLPKSKIEGFVVGKIRSYVLTDENVMELVRLTNEELASLSKGEGEQLKILEAQTRDLDSRLEHLYNALETGTFHSEELAPRIRKLLARKSELQAAKEELLCAFKAHKAQIEDVETVKAYVKDLKSLLGSASILEQRTFLKSFIQEIKIGRDEITFNYTLPMPPQNITVERVGVLPFVQNGGR